MKSSECLLLLSIFCRKVGDMSEGLDVPVGDGEILINQNNTGNNYVHLLQDNEFSSLKQGFAVPDLNKAPVTIVIMDYPPYSVLYDRTSSGLRGTGETWLILDALQTFFNFSPVLRLAKNSFEIINKLENKEADLTLMPMEITESRSKVIDFSSALGSSTYGMLIKRPQNTPKPDALLRPFNYEVWSYILLSMAIMGPLIYGITRTRIRLCRGEKHMTKFFSLDQCIWFVFSALMKQGSTLEPIADSSRILFATWWMFIVIVTAFYTANLTAFLTFNGLELPITGVDSLSSHPKLSWLAPRSEALVSLIETQNDMSVLRQMQEEGRGEFINSTEEALEKVRAGTHVLIEDQRVLNYIIYKDFITQRRNGNESCQFYTTLLETRQSTWDILKLRIFWGFGFAKNSSLLHDFNLFFKRLQHYGLHDYHHSTYASKKVCNLPKGFKERPLQNRDLLTTYYMIFVGAGLGFLVFFTECFIGRGRKQSKGNLKNNVNKEFYSSYFDSKKKGYVNSAFLDNHLSSLPSRTRTPFAIKYPDHPDSSNHSDDEYPNLNPSKSKKKGISKENSLFAKTSNNILNLKKLNLEKIKKIIKSRSSDVDDEDTGKTPEYVLLTSLASRDDLAFDLHKTAADLIEGSVNGLQVVWNKKTNQLMVKDLERLEGRIIMSEGSPCIYLKILHGRKFIYQKLVLNDYRYKAN